MFLLALVAFAFFKVPFIVIGIVAVLVLIFLVIDARANHRNAKSEYSYAIGALRLNGWRIDKDFIGLLHTMEVDGHLNPGTTQKVIDANPPAAAAPAAPVSIADPGPAPTTGATN